MSCSAARFASSSGARNSSSTSFTTARSLIRLLRPAGVRADRVAAAVVLVAAAFHQAGLLQGVEDADEHAPVDPERVRDGGLRLAGALAEEGEHAVVERIVAGALELGERPGLHRRADLREQEAGAGEQLLRHPRERA